MVAKAAVGHPMSLLRARAWLEDLQREDVQAEDSTLMAVYETTSTAPAKSASTLKKTLRDGKCSSAARQKPKKRKASPEINFSTTKPKQSSEHKKKEHIDSKEQGFVEHNQRQRPYSSGRKGPTIHRIPILHQHVNPTAYEKSRRLYEACDLEEVFDETMTLLLSLDSLPITPRTKLRNIRGIQIAESYEDNGRGTDSPRHHRLECWGHDATILEAFRDLKVKRSSQVIPNQPVFVMEMANTRRRPRSAPPKARDRNSTSQMGSTKLSTKTSKKLPTKRRAGNKKVSVISKKSMKSRKQKQIAAAIETAAAQARYEASLNADAYRVEKMSQLYDQRTEFIIKSHASFNRRLELQNKDLQVKKDKRKAQERAEEIAGLPVELQELFNSGSCVHSSRSSTLESSLPLHAPKEGRSQQTALAGTTGDVPEASTSIMQHAEAKDSLDENQLSKKMANNTATEAFVSTQGNHMSSELVNRKWVVDFTTEQASPGSQLQTNSTKSEESNGDNQLFDEIDLDCTLSRESQQQSLCMFEDDWEDVDSALDPTSPGKNDSVVKHKIEPIVPGQPVRRFSNASHDSVEKIAHLDNFMGQNYSVDAEIDEIVHIEEDLSSSTTPRMLDGIDSSAIKKAFPLQEVRLPHVDTLAKVHEAPLLSTSHTLLASTDSNVTLSINLKTNAIESDEDINQNQDWEVICAMGTTEDSSNEVTPFNETGSKDQVKAMTEIEFAEEYLSKPKLNSAQSSQKGLSENKLDLNACLNEENSSQEKPDDIPEPLYLDSFTNNDADVDAIMEGIDFGMSTPTPLAQSTFAFPGSPAHVNLPTIHQNSDNAPFLSIFEDEDGDTVDAIMESIDFGVTTPTPLAKNKLPFAASPAGRHTKYIISNGGNSSSEFCIPEDDEIGGSDSDINTRRPIAFTNDPNLVSGEPDKVEKSEAFAPPYLSILESKEEVDAIMASIDFGMSTPTPLAQSKIPFLTSPIANNKTKTSEKYVAPERTNKAVDTPKTVQTNGESIVDSTSPRDNASQNLDEEDLDADMFGNLSLEEN